MVHMLLLAVLAARAPVAAWPQQVTADFDQAPIGQVLAELERQTGLRISHPFRAGEDEPLVDLHVEGASIRGVLRALCQQAGCWFRTSSQAVEVRLGADPLEAAPTVQAGPYIVRLRSLRIAHSWAADFERPQENQLVTGHEMSLELQVESDEDRYLEALVAFHPAVRAVADTGEAVQPRVIELPPRPTLDRSYVHEGLIRERIRLDAPGAQAVSLTSIEGDLVVRKDPRVVRLEFPLAAGLGAQSAEGHTFALTDTQPLGANGYTVKGQWDLAPDPGTGVGLPGRLPFYTASLLTAEGQRVIAVRQSVRVGRPPGAERSRLFCEWQFEPVGEAAPERFVFEWVVTAVETELVHYRFDDVLLPTWEE